MDAVACVLLLSGPTAIGTFCAKIGVAIIAANINNKSKSRCPRMPNLSFFHAIGTSPDGSNAS